MLKLPNGTAPHRCMKGNIMRDFRWFTDFFNTGLGTAIKAVLLLVLAFEIPISLRII